MESGKDKVKKICDVLKRETLEPAKEEAEEIVAQAQRAADEMLAKAHAEAEKLLQHAHMEVERQKAAFEASLSQACRQAVAMLKEQIEHKLFHPELSKLIAKPMQDPKVLAQLIAAVVKAIDKEGLEADLSAYISSSVPAKAVNELLVAAIVERLKEKGVLLSSIGGGIEVRLAKENMTIDVSDAAVKEVVADYIRKDFRALLYV